MQLISLRVFHWLIMFHFLFFNILIIMKLVYIFQRVFRPRWTCIQCTMQTALADAFGHRSHPGTCKNDSFSFLFPFCVRFYFRASDTHDFVHFFHPQSKRPPRMFSSTALFAPISGLGLAASHSPSSSTSLPFLIIFPVGSAWSSKNAVFRGSSVCRLFSTNACFWGLPVDAIPYWPSYIKPD